MALVRGVDVGRDDARGSSVAMRERDWTSLVDTRLHDVCYSGQMAQLEVLLSDPSTGSLLGARDRAGDTALHLATLGGHKRIVARLLEECPELCNAQDNQGWTALHYAASTGNSAVAEVLLDSGADMRPDKNGSTPIHEVALKVRCSRLW